MRLLLSEDEHALSRALTILLKHNNYSEEVVDNDTDALVYLQEGSYDDAIWIL